MNRVLELFIIALWLTSMTLLVSRDAVPRWFAVDPPQPASAAWLEKNGLRFQYGIFDQSGLSKGSCWTVYQPNGQTITRHDLLVLEGVPLIRRLVISSELTYLNESQLARAEIEITGIHAPVILKGERQGPKFAFEIKIGTAPAYHFVLDSDAARTLSDIIKPFSTMQGLQVGQAWKIHVIDPMSLIRNGPRSKLSTIVVTVTAQEPIQINGRERLCFVVESPGARAWVDEQGRVLKQLVTLPGLGQLEIREQSFQRDHYEDVLRTSRNFRYYESGSD